MSLPDLARDQDRLRELHKGSDVVLVPTMGALHEGHLALLRRAREIADQGDMSVCASVFVNPTQFGPGEDYRSYPRRLDEDLKALTGLADTCYAPPVEDLYPAEQEIFIHAPALGSELCGAFRPGHFQGVLTVVCKLFFAARPKVAVFGEKDYQQLVLIKKMAGQLGLGVAIESVPTVREPDGLALSSRNERLSDGERKKAPLLYGCLAKATEEINAGASPKQSCTQATGELEKAGFRVDYVECRSLDLSGFKDKDLGFVVLAAANLGKVRLIDNVCHRT